MRKKLCESESTVVFLILSRDSYGIFIGWNDRSINYSLQHIYKSIYDVNIQRQHISVIYMLSYRKKSCSQIHIFLWHYKSNLPTPYCRMNVWKAGRLNTISLPVAVSSIHWAGQGGKGTPACTQRRWAQTQNGGRMEPGFLSGLQDRSEGRLAWESTVSEQGVTAIECSVLQRDASPNLSFWVEGRWTRFELTLHFWRDKFLIRVCQNVELFQGFGYEQWRSYRWGAGRVYVDCELQNVKTRWEKNFIGNWRG